MQPQACDLNELIRESAPLLKRATGEVLSLQLSLCEDEAIALIDPAQFEASLLNLLVNAADASPPGADITLETKLAELAAGELPNLPPGRYLRVSVADRGEGMNEAILSRIFEPFFTTKPPGKGTGLGLSQVYGFVRQSGGEVQVHSEPNHGTTFNVYLPIGAALPAVDVAGDRPLETPALALSILLAEDDPAVADIAEVMLTDLGHKVIRAANAAEALQVLSSDTHVDVLLSDVLMPGDMNGVELAKEAQKLRPQLRILLSSGYAGEMLDTSIAQSGWPFLRKPYLVSELAQTLARLRAAGHHGPDEARMQA